MLQRRSAIAVAVVGSNPCGSGGMDVTLPSRMRQRGNHALWRRLSTCRMAVLTGSGQLSDLVTPVPNPNPK